MIKTIYNNLIISYNRYYEITNAKTALNELYTRLNIGSIVESDESDDEYGKEEEEENDDDNDNNEEMEEKENINNYESPKKKRKIINNESEENSLNSIEDDDLSTSEISFDKNLINEILKQHSIDSAEILQNKLYHFFYNNYLIFL